MPVLDKVWGRFHIYQVLGRWYWIFDCGYGDGVRVYFRISLKNFFGRYKTWRL